EVSKTKRTWTAVDDKGNTVSVSQTITVEDTMAPSLTLAGASAMSVLLNGTYVEPGATAFDDCAGTCPVGVVGSVNVTAPGMYTLIYVASDSRGNSATATRTVWVIYQLGGTCNG